MNRCDGCGLWSSSFVIYSHLNSDERYGLCPMCRQDEEILAEVQRAFAAEIAERRAAWTGPTGTELERLKKRMVTSSIGRSRK